MNSTAILHLCPTLIGITSGSLFLGDLLASQFQQFFPENAQVMGFDVLCIDFVAVICKLTLDLELLDLLKEFWLCKTQATKLRQHLAGEDFFWGDFFCKQLTEAAQDRRHHDS